MGEPNTCTGPHSAPVCQCRALFRCSAGDNLIPGTYRRMTLDITTNNKLSAIEFGTLFSLLPSFCMATLSGLFLQKSSENQHTSDTTSCLQRAARHTSFLLQKPPYNPDTAISAVQMETGTKYWDQNPDTHDQTPCALTKLLLSLSQSSTGTSGEGAVQAPAAFAAPGSLHSNA